MNMYRVLLVDDQDIVRQGLKVMLEQDDDIIVTHEAENGQQAIDILHKHIIDLDLMDVRMPVMNGIEATRKIKENWPKVKVLILTTFNDEQYAIETLKDGADGYLLKTAKMMPKLSKKEPREANEYELTTRETMTVQLIGGGKTKQEIADELFLSVGSVKNYLTQILQQTGFRDRTQLAIYAVRRGLAAE